MVASGGPVFWQERAVRFEEISSLVDQSDAVEHVNAAEEEMMRVDQVVVDLGVLT